MVTPFQGENHRVKFAASLSQYSLAEVNGKASILSERVSALGVVLAWRSFSLLYL